MRLRELTLSLGLLVLACSAIGQRVDLKDDRVAMTELAGPWRFHTGDNPAWANPDFNDSGWSLLRSDQGWTQQGYAGYGGAAWYRLQVTLPPKPGPLVLYIQALYASCQIFANGRLIGQHGGLPPNPQLLTTGRLILPIPDDIATSGQLLLAIRVWEPTQYASFSRADSILPRALAKYSQSSNGVA